MVSRLIITAVTMVAMCLVASGCSGEYGVFHRDYGDTRSYHNEFQSGERVRK